MLIVAAVVSMWIDRLPLSLSPESNMYILWVHVHVIALHVTFRYKLSEVARIAEVMDVCATCVHDAESIFVSVLVELIQLCRKVSELPTTCTLLHRSASQSRSSFPLPFPPSLS